MSHPLKLPVLWAGIPADRLGVLESVLISAEISTKSLMMTYSMQQMCQAIVAVTGEDPIDIRNKIRNWVTDGLILGAEISGTGRGVRRTYNRATIFDAAILIRLSQLDMRPAELRHKLSLIQGLHAPKWQNVLDAGQPVYMIGRPPSAKRGGFVLTEFTDSLSDVENHVADGVGYWVDVGTIHRELAKWFEIQNRTAADG